MVSILTHIGDMSMEFLSELLIWDEYSSEKCIIIKKIDPRGMNQLEK